MTHREVIEFITEHIIHRFGIPQILTTDKGSSFIKGGTYIYRILQDQVAQLISILCSGQWIKLIKKKIEENPKRWHEVLSKALWAHRISRHGATKVFFYSMVLLRLLLLSLCMVKRPFYPLR